MANIYENLVIPPDAAMEDEETYELWREEAEDSMISDIIGLKEDSELVRSTERGCYFLRPHLSNRKKLWMLRSY